MERPLTLGRYMKRLRIDKGLSLLEVCSRSGRAYTHLSRIENDSLVPSPASIAKLAEALDGDVTVMLKLADTCRAPSWTVSARETCGSRRAALRRAMPPGGGASQGGEAPARAGRPHARRSRRLLPSADGAAAQPGTGRPGNWVARWLERNRADHYAHAEVYCLLAEKLRPEPLAVS